MKLLVFWLTQVILFSHLAAPEKSQTYLDQSKDIVSSINVTTTSGLDQNTRTAWMTATTRSQQYRNLTRNPWNHRRAQ